MLENYSWDGDKQDAASQDKEQRGCHTDFSLTDLVLFILRSKSRRGEGERETYTFYQEYKLLNQSHFQQGSKCDCDLTEDFVPHFFPP